MKASSAKNKGSRFENYLVEIFRKQLDPKAHRTNGSGSGLDKNDVILPNYDIEIEAKNKSQFSLITDWEQLKRQRTNVPNVLAVRHPQKPEFQETLIIMDLGDFIELLQSKGIASQEAELPPDLKWKVKRLKDSANDVFKHLDTD